MKKISRIQKVLEFCKSFTDSSRTEVARREKMLIMQKALELSNSSNRFHRNIKKYNNLQNNVKKCNRWY